MAMVCSSVLAVTQSGQRWGSVTYHPLEYLDTNAPPGSAFYRTSTGP